MSEPQPPDPHPTIGPPGLASGPEVPRPRTTRGDVPGEGLRGRRQCTRALHAQRHLSPVVTRTRTQERNRRPWGSARRLTMATGQGVGTVAAGKLAARATTLVQPEQRGNQRSGGRDYPQKQTLNRRGPTAYNGPFATNPLRNTERLNAQTTHHYHM